MELGIDWPSDFQLKQAWDKLDEMQVGDKLKMEMSKNPPLFIQACKMHIACFKQHQFNKDYSVIKRISNPTVEPKPEFRPEWRLKKVVEL